MKTFADSLGQVASIIGAQWGDEGKGKVTDILAEHFDVIARACGGANAGHTIIVDGKKHIFHLLPSGCLHKGKIIVLGAGMVIHLPTLVEELDTLKAAGVDIMDYLYISPNAHILLDFHKAVDEQLEDQRSKSKGKGIGTTKRGIGPAYMDKAGRVGMRMEKLRHSLEEIEEELKEHADRVSDWHNLEVEIKAELENIAKAKEMFQKRLLLSIPELLNTFLHDGKRILIEGAQATMLDIDHGTYPYVTSSQTTVAGALQGLGLNPRALSGSIGVAKAYCTRVGEGDFSTEVDGEVADRIRERGKEFGSTTGRPRRVGWLYLPDLRYGMMINGFQCWNITKLDVLDEEEIIPVGVDTDPDGNIVYENLPGWQESTVGVKKFEDLPENAQKYIQFLEQNTGIPASLIGTGPNRENMIIRS